MSGTWLFGILYKKIAEARRARQRDRQMDEIDEAFERRFDASGHWSTPPQPVDTDLHHKEVETESLRLPSIAAPLRQTLAFILTEVEEALHRGHLQCLGDYPHQPRCDAASHQEPGFETGLESKGVRE